MIRILLFFCILLGGLITSLATAGPLFVMEFTTTRGEGHYGGWGCAVWVVAYAVGALWTFRSVT